jgi:hypothetical protein
VFLPREREREPGEDARGIFETVVRGIESADGIASIMDGADPDFGT